MGRTACRFFALLCAASARLAHAQLLQDPATIAVPPEPRLTAGRSVFDRDSDIPVAERQQPGMIAQGLKLGNFTLYPALAVSTLYTSNLFADNNRKVGDAAIVARPELLLRTSQGPYSFQVYGQGDLRRYASHVSENTQEGRIGTEGAVGISAFSSVSAGVSYAALITPRYASESPANAARPLAYRALAAHVGTTLEGARNRLSLRADILRLRYSDPLMVGGGTLFAGDRDRTRYQADARAEHAFSPAVSIYFAGSFNRVDYRLQSQDVSSRDSSGFGVYLGSSFEITRLVHGDVRVGYIEQDFKVGRFPAIAGFGAQGEVAVFPNRLWTITLRGESSVQDSGVPGTTGVLHRGGTIRADYEMRRYLITSLEGGYFVDQYRGIERRDRLPFAGASVTYLSRNHSNVQLAYRYTARDCNCAALATSFGDHRVVATLTLQI